MPIDTIIAPLRPDPTDTMAMSRLIGRAALTLAGIAAMAILLIDGMAMTAADDGRLDLALRLRPSWTFALSEAASRDLAAGRDARATGEATAALVRNPLDVVALRVAGIGRMQANDPQRALSFMSLAGKLSWRDDGTQLWLLSQALQSADYEAAMQHLDALLRLQHEVEVVSPLLLRLSNTPAACNAIAARLADDPPWRDYYIFLLATSPPAPAQAVAEILIAAHRQGATFPADSLAGLFLRMRKDGDDVIAQSLQAALYNDVEAK